MSWRRWLLPLSGEPRRNPDVSDGARALRMLDAALRILIAAAVIWLLVRR